jgi:hypothetical protein
MEVLEGLLCQRIKWETVDLEVVRAHRETLQPAEVLEVEADILAEKVRQLLPNPLQLVAVVVVLTIAVPISPVPLDFRQIWDT